MAVKVLNGCGVLKVDNDTIVLDDTTNVISVADGVVALPIATNSTLGGVIPDGDIITVGETGTITVADASTTNKGVVLQAENQEISTATTVELLLADFNALLLKLKTAGIMVTDI